jgi:Glutamate-1-semialdehyde aminotransferase
VATLGLPDTAGVPESFAATTIALPFNNLEAVAQAFKKKGDRIACVIVEPVAGNMGCVPPAPGFLEGLLSLCEKYGALLILDEVMTGFRVAYGGAQQRYGIRPHLTMIGKVIGGGLPIAAYGGRKGHHVEGGAGGSHLPGRDAIGESAGCLGGNCHAAAFEGASGHL